MKLVITKTIAILLMTSVISSCMNFDKDGLQSLPSVGLYNGSAISSDNTVGTSFGMVYALNSFGTQTSYIELAINYNNQVLNLFSGSLATTSNNTAQCLSGSNSRSIDNLSSAVSSSVITLTNCQYSNSQFSANYSIYQQASGLLLDSGSISISLDNSCALSTTNYEPLPNAKYSGAITSCAHYLGNISPGAITGNITSSQIVWLATFESTVGIESNQAKITGYSSDKYEYSTTLSESVLYGNNAGYHTQFYLGNINVANNQVQANYVSFYDYGSLLLSYE